MKFLIFGDLHGNIPKVHYKNFDAVITPGDFCSDDARKYMFLALKENLKKNSRIDWYDLIGRENAEEIIKKSMSDGRKVLEKLNSFGVPVYTVPGNWDWTSDEASSWNFLRKDHYKNLVKGFDNIIDVNHKIKDTGDYEFIGYGISSGPEYPQDKEDLKRLKLYLKDIKKEYENELRKIDFLFKKASKPIIFLSHNVPFNTPIDIIIDKSPRKGQHFGSLIVREMINKYEPLVDIAGHMHEHFGKCKIGRTICINAGYGPNKNILLEIENNKIKSLEFHE